jgi:hypothetical protein
MANPRIIVLSDSRIRVCCDEEGTHCVDFGPQSVPSNAGPILTPRPLPPAIATYSNRQLQFQASAAYLGPELDRMDAQLAAGVWGDEATQAWDRAPIVVVAQPHEVLHLPDFDGLVDWATPQGRVVIIQVAEWTPPLQPSWGGASSVAQQQVIPIR